MTTDEVRSTPEYDEGYPGGEEASLADALEFMDNPEPRCPCVLLLDKSYSMNDNGAIHALNEGIQTLKTELEKDNVASLRVELAIVTFGGGVNLVQDFVTVGDFDPPQLVADGSATQMAGGIEMALDIVEERKDTYREKVEYFRPWVFMITDGEPTGESEAFIDDIVKRLREEENSKKVAFFAVGVEGANMKRLSGMIPRQPLPLRGLAFNELFSWLSASLRSVSDGEVTDGIQLDNNRLHDWAEIS